MQVNNFPSGLQQLQHVNSVDAATKQQDNLRTDGNVIGQITPEEQPAQPKTRFDVSEQALNVVAFNYEQNQQSIEKVDRQENSSSYDQPSSKNKTAVSAYQNVNNISQREDIKSVFGVDLFA